MVKSCKLIVGTVAGNDGEYELSRSGWSSAHRKALDVAKGGKSFSTRPLALVDLQCDGGRIALYQCSRDTRTERVTCAIETPGGSGSAIAGTKREPPPVYHPRQGPPPGVPVLKGARLKRRR
jgi:hypothetical protein